VPLCEGQVSIRRSVAALILFKAASILNLFHLGFRQGSKLKRFSRSHLSAKILGMSEQESKILALRGDADSEVATGEMIAGIPAWLQRYGSTWSTVLQDLGGRDEVSRDPEKINILLNKLMDKHSEISSAGGAADASEETMATWESGASNKWAHAKSHAANAKSTNSADGIIAKRQQPKKGGSGRNGGRGPMTRPDTCHCGGILGLCGSSTVKQNRADVAAGRQRYSYRWACIACGERAEQPERHLQVDGIHYKYVAKTAPKDSNPPKGTTKRRR